jgi:hypothetical protein
MDSPFIHKEFFNTLIGKQLGKGSARTVYAFSANPELVVKVEIGGESFQNVREWEYWKEMKDSPMAKYLAPCEYISPCGAVLIQGRVLPLDRSKYPKKIPANFTDTKYQNFGLYKNKFVCCDYGNIPFAKGVSAKMVKAHWWGDIEID